MRAYTCSTSPAFLLQWRRPTFSTNLHKPIFSASISTQSTSYKPKTPLFLRPPTYSATLSDFNKWKEWANNLAISVGSTFVNSDKGPDQTLLCRELKWLIEDAVEDYPKIFHLDNLEIEKSIKLRVELDDLYHLWSQRIEKRRPFQYIVGCEHWRDLVLSVEEGVLIPRPETELIVDLVYDVISKDEGLKEGLWADLGTGSGALAIGIGRVLGSLGKIIATDLSPVAISIAMFNVQRHDLQSKIEVRQGSWFEPLSDVKGKLAGIVSNPPYIPSEHMHQLQAEVGRHEPYLALDGGMNGMDCLIHLCNGASSMLRPGGYFVFETNGEEQCKYLVDFLENDFNGRFCNVKIVSDFAGIKRFVTGYHC